MTARDEVIINEIMAQDGQYVSEVEFIITDSLNFTLTQLFDEAICCMAHCGLDYINATVFYQQDEDTKLELAWLEFDDTGKYIDGFTYGYAVEMLKMLKIKYK